MKRSILAVLCFSVLFAASATAGDPTDTYISTRDRYIAQFKAHPSTDASDKRMDRALADLEQQLATIVPRWNASSVSSKGKINLDTLTQEDLGFGRLDGLTYEKSGVTVLVTTPPLLRRWIADHNKWWKGEDNIPQPLDAAIRSEPFWTYAMFGDARGIPYGEVVITPPKGSVQSAAIVATYAQDLVFDSGPTEILAAVIFPDHVFLIRQKLAATTQPIPVCRTALHETRAKADATYKAYQASKLKDAAKFDTATHLDEQADRQYRACFAAHLREQPRYNAIREQAQALANLLH